MARKPGQEGPSRLDMVKVWLLDPRSRLVLRRRLAEVRLTRRSLLAAGMAVWLLYAALVWQFGGRRLDDCTSLACRALLGGLPFGPGDSAPPAAAAGPSTSTPTVSSGGQAPGTTPFASSGTTTSTPVLPVVILVPSTAGAPAPTAGEPTSTTLPAPAEPGSSTTTTTDATTTTVPEPRCKPKKHRECKPKNHPTKWPWWLRHLADFRGGW